MAEFDVVVIGAGMAGLTAARALLERGLRVCVVEAQQRVGGRILTREIEGECVEMGAEFVHGRPPELWALIDEAGLETWELDGVMVSSDGAGGFQAEEEEEEDRFTLLDGLENFAGPDAGFLGYVDRLEIEPEDRDRIVSYVEGFNAADAREASILALGAQQKAEESIEGDRLWKVRGGYAQVPEYLAGCVRRLGGELRLGFAVEEIAWQQDAVRVSGDGEQLHARSAVVAVSLGVLQARRIRFTPAPANRLELVDRLRMGAVCRFTLVFREQFWESKQPRMSFLFAFEETPSVWWTTHPESHKTLTGWVGGPRSEALNGRSAGELAEAACEALGRVFAMTTEEIKGLLIECAVHDWQADPWALGAYSYIAAGELDTPHALGEPVEDTLFFCRRTHRCDGALGDRTRGDAQRTAHGGADFIHTANRRSEGLTLKLIISI